MKTRRLEVEGFRSLSKATVDFEDLTLLVGKNDSGKSNVLKALDIFFKGMDSDELRASSKGGGGGNEFSYRTGVRDLRIFNKQRPGTIRIIGHLELSDTETRHLFPDEEFLVENRRFNRDELGNVAVISRTISTDGTQIRHEVEYMKLGTVPLVRTGEGGAPLRRTKGIYSYGGAGTDVASVLLSRMKTAYRVVPGVRALSQEARSEEAPNENGTHVPSFYLRLEKDVSLKSQDTFKQIQEDISNMFQYKGVTSMENGRGGVDVYFEDLPSSSIGDGGRQVFVTVFALRHFLEHVFGIEEPEIHLHPEAQRKLLSFLKERASARQILATTHSSSLAGAANLSNLRLVTKNKEGETSIHEVSEDNVQDLVEELGVRPSDLLDDDAVVFVEGPSDESIFKSFCKTLGIASKIGFISTEGWNSMAYYANARVLASKRIKIPVFVIFDGETEKDRRHQAIKERLTRQLSLESNRILTLTGNSIEDYLLIPRAIKSAFSTIALTESQIEAIISKNQTKVNKKGVLDLVFRKGGLGKYKEMDGARIAEEMRKDEISQELRRIIDVIDRSVTSR